MALSKIILVCIFAIPLVHCFSQSREENVTLARQKFVHPYQISHDMATRIIGGEEVVPNSYPSQVALLIYTSDGVYFCGGSLISNQWVLTAAHCVYQRPSAIAVILGAHNLALLDSTTVVVMNSTKYVYHEQWDENTLQNDVGLVKLPRNVTFTSSINTAKIANGTDTYVDVTGTIVGWGKTQNVGDISYVLRKVDTRVMDNSDCAATSSAYQQIIKPTHLCTSGAGTVGSCNGDSGGPLIVNGTQVGIVSFGTEDCELGNPSVFTRVTDFHDWIVTHAVDGASSHDSVQFAAIITVTLCIMHLFK